jgi:AcrR family transcriptional regulator
MVYTEIMSSDASPRPYRKRKRAEQEQETRRRITEAAVQLHGTAGPANTAVTDVAKLAGVSRMTVYNHFPTETDLFRACSTHWATVNPFPRPSAWAGIDDPSERLITALRELYRWYRLKQDMLGKVLRDTPILPSLARVMDDLWWPYLQEIVRTLAVGWPVEQRDDAELKAVLRVAVDFDTWRTLTDSGLDHERAPELAARMVTAGAAARSYTASPRGDQRGRPD